MFVALATVWIGQVRAQSIKDGEHALRDAVLKQQRYLRGFSADGVMRWRWDGSSLALEPFETHMLGVFVARSVKVKGSRVEIQGELHELVLRKDGSVTASPEKNSVSLEVDLHGADVAAVLPKLASLLFYPDQQSALDDLPPRYKAVLPINADGARAPLKRMRGCDCASPCGASSHGTRGVTPPRITHQVDPEFSEEARRRKFSGRVEVGLVVSSAGVPEDLWIVRSAGMGLDEKAAEAVSGYRFAPATCHDQPTAVDLYVDVNFRIF
jgi:TonB family protein